jgi:flagellar hook assembly protein FlgD
MAEMAVPAAETTASILPPAKQKPVSTTTEAENKQHFDSMLYEEQANSEKKLAEHSGQALKSVFTDPQKMLKLWLLNETRPNPFCEEQKDPMESFGKFIQSMLMQTQTDSLNQLKETMVSNNKYAAMDLMDKMVEIESDKMTIAPGRKIIQNFTVPENIQGYGVTIENSAGEVVYKKLAYDVNPGINQFVWEGTDQDDKSVPVGDYKISISLQRKTTNEEGMPKFEHLEFATDLSGKPINEEIETLSTVDRNVQFSYELPEGLKDLEYASVWILNSKNTAVHKADIEAKSGQKAVYSWNCLDANGQRVPEDVYSIQINLKDGKRDMLKTDKNAIIRVTGKVQGVEVHEGGEPNLITSRIKAPLSTVKRIISEAGL